MFSSQGVFIYRNLRMVNGWYAEWTKGRLSGFKTRIGSLA